MSRPTDARADWTLTTGSGLTLDVTTRPDSALLDEFFAGYDAAFVLPDEKEDLDGFRACLALGQGEARRRHEERYGPHVEVVVVARVAGRGGGDMVGGANFIAYPLGPDLVAGNLNYIFVKPEFRHRGLFRKLTAGCGQLMRDLFGLPAARTLTFIELNDPFVLSDADYARDSETAGVDQFDRVKIWTRLDARIVDFAYVQPPLSAQQQPDSGLIYAVLGAADLADLDPDILRRHLERFFGISVLKGVEPWDAPVAAAQLAELEAMARRGERVRLQDPGPAIEPGRTLRASGGPRPASFRQFLRRRSEGGDRR